MPTATQSTKSLVPIPQPPAEIGSLQSFVIPATSPTPVAPKLHPVINTDQALIAPAQQAPTSPQSLVSPISPAALALLEDQRAVEADHVLAMITDAGMTAMMLNKKLNDGGKFLRRIDDIKARLPHVIRC